MTSEYGLTPTKFRELIASQDWKCAICGKDPRTDLAARPAMRCLHVDHDHATGKYRALLCSPCNTGIGLLKDNSELVRKAAAYLETHGA